MDVLDGSNGIISSSGYITEQKHKQGMFPLESDLVLVRRIIGDVRGERFLYTYCICSVFCVCECLHTCMLACMISSGNS